MASLVAGMARSYAGCGARVFAASGHRERRVQHHAHDSCNVNATRLARQLHATELLFQAVTDPDRLREAIAATAELLGAQAGVLVVGRPSGGSRRVVRVQPVV